MEAVLAAKAAGDVETLSRAAVQLWLAPHDDERGADESVMQVWEHLAASKAEVPALGALLTAVMEGHRPRPAAFVLLATSVTPDKLVGLAEVVIAAGWRAQPYLSIVFDALVEDRQPKVVESIIAKHRATLHGRTDTWVAIAYLLTATRVGDRHAVDDWFRGWEERAGVPMWLVAYYAASWMPIVKDPWQRLIDLAEVALRMAELDETSPFFETFIAIDDLAHNRTSDFRKRMAELQPRLAAFLKDYQDTAATQDVQTYVVVGPAANIVGLIGAALWAKDAIVGREDRPEQALGERAYTIVRHCFRANRILGNVLVLLDAEKDSPAASAAFHDMVGRSVYPMIESVWKDLAKAKLSWSKRVKLAHFS